MKTKKLKVVLTIFMLIMVVMTSTPVFAGDPLPADGTDTGTTGKGANDTAIKLLEDIKPDVPEGTDTGKLGDLAGAVIGLIQLASAVAAVILIAVFGFKFIMGSAQEKSDYQKSFIPLIVGVVVVFAATSIAKLLFTTFTNVL